MAMTVKTLTLWRGEIANRPGALADVLEPFAAHRADLQAVMGYRIPGHTERAVVEVAPVTGRRLAEAAKGEGLAPAHSLALLVTGDNRPGLGHAFARALGGAGINMSFVVAQVVGRRYSAIFGFESAADAKQAAKLIRKAAR